MAAVEEGDVIMADDDAAATAAAAVAAAAESRFSELVFEYSLETDASAKAALQSRIMEEVQKHSMAPLYEATAQQLGWKIDAALLADLKAKNEVELKRLDEKIAEMKEKFGDVEVFDAQRDKAEHFARIGDKEGALKAFADVAEKKLSTGQKIDVAIAKMRLGIVLHDQKLARASLVEAKELNEKGGDWDRRNRLKVYEGVLAMGSRDFNLACTLLLDSVATFTATELFDYQRLVFYAVLLSLKELGREALKKRVISSPDVLSVINAVPHLETLLKAFYEGRYGEFMGALAGISPALSRDRFLSTHASYYVREMRVAAYAQFLESYKSVTVAGMARSFSVSPAFLDAELARFISAGRLNAKIDAVKGVIETTRPDSKNAQYHSVLKQGDALLNRIQRLSRVAAV